MRTDVKVMAVILLLAVGGVFAGAYFYRGSVEQKRQPPTMNSALVRDDSPSMGPADAAVTVVEFLDPECESCAAFAPAVKRVLGEFDGKVRFVIRYMPLHPNSMRAATFLEYAGEEGKFWEALDLLFRKQKEWGEDHHAPPGAPKPDVTAMFDGYAKELGVDLEKYLEAARSNRFAEKIDRDRKDGQSLGVRRTPTFFVNGRELARLSETDLRRMINEELAK